MNQNHVVTKVVRETGFDLYLDGGTSPWIIHEGAQAKPFDPNQTIEWNAQKMLEEKMDMFTAMGKPYTQGQYDAVVESQIKEGVL